MLIDKETMASLPLTNDWAPRWLYRWAVLTVVATVLLLVIGAVVTTFRVGMADPVWPTSPWHLLLVSWDEPKPGFLIEHTHRLAGYIVGCCVLVLALGLWSVRSPGWLKTLGGVSLGAVIVQGLLGGFRVYLNALLGPNLAAIHGLFAQVVFCLLVSVAVLTSPSFRASSLAEASACRGLRRNALLLAVLSLAQLTWGVLIRHLNSPVAQRLHFLFAFGVVAAAAWLASRAAANPEARRLLRGPLILLGILLLAQVSLGVEAWLAKYGSGSLLPELERVSVGQAIIRTAHVLLGSWVLATSVVLTLLTFRPAAVGHAIAEVERAGSPLDAFYHAPHGISAAHHLEGTA
jgi:heme A synthase